MKQTLLKLNQVNLGFPGILRPVLKNITYNVDVGDFIILLGTNGSGKSSLLKVLSKQYPITHGRILLQDKDLATYLPQQLAKHIVTLTQNYQNSLFISLTVLENYLLIKQFHDNHLLQLSSLKERRFFADYILEFNKNLPKKLDVPVIHLSGGEQQALALALGILYPPKILLLDEHTSALDPQAGLNLMEITAKVVRKYGITCILSTHDLHIALNYGDKILALANGEIVQNIDAEQKKQLGTQDLLKMCY